MSTRRTIERRGQRHADRLIESHRHRPRDLRILRDMARRECRWVHVDWSVVDDAMEGAT